ncbi:NIPSNAP family protein [Paraglaciecola aquimarina]|uniref:NIPSNAP family protein n=1 Tax=Paraglaciecola algarum TaxID=3050085 RepID=A0ABS9D9B9_9ALTE|nr:NIPSNAP family protein [Paraglaciecola sp. G1-23]MCF2948251.1 NIPSNAP family protein [Paraglaciecola sp. G1-23]
MTNSKKVFVVYLLSSLFGVFSLIVNAAHHGEDKTSNKVYEMRTYYAHEGKLEALKSRFRDHTDGIFNRLGMKSIAYWVPTSEPGSKNTLIYILEHKSEAEAKKNWQIFIKDPQWVKAYKASIVDGPLVEKIDVVFMQTTDFSAL